MVGRRHMRVAQAMPDAPFADPLERRRTPALVVLSALHKPLRPRQPCRQGSMERWNSASSKWRAGHLVLTRAGFLHFFLPESAAAKAAALAGGSGAGGSSSGGGGIDGAGGSSGSLRSSPSAGQLPWGGADSWSPPLESINLSRCSFEQGERFAFRHACHASMLPKAGMATCAGDARLRAPSLLHACPCPRALPAPCPAQARPRCFGSSRRERGPWVALRSSPAARAPRRCEQPLWRSAWTGR